jgi:hypothetical protein
LNVRDTAERLGWTVVAAVGGNLIGAALFSFDVWKAAAAAGLGAAVNFATIVARSRLKVLPDPGAGLPGLPTAPTP